ncbi:MAG TPA: hypothetical protein VGG39_16235 [Polyangiaceae bacterium]|jgi:hypothetical protein
MPDLGERGRRAIPWLCGLFFGSELLLIATAGMRSDRSYGFRMFPESSTVEVHVSRRLGDGRTVPIEAGRWRAHDCSGGVHAFSWGRMVRFPAPSRLDAPVGAPYGVESEIHRTRDALAWVAAHTPQDCETRALVARVVPTRNGRVLDPVEFEAARAP